MPNWILYFEIYIAVAIFIGIPLGVKSFNLLIDEEFGHYGAMTIPWKLSLFPLLGWNQKLSQNLPLFHCILRIRKKEDADVRMFWYVFLTALFWPIRVAWNLFGIIVIACRLFGILISD